jgi:outer membrane biosynthesis protein TonB
MHNDFKACDRPRPADATSIGRSPSRGRRTLRGLLVLPLALMLIAPGAALAVEPTSGYSQTTPAPTTPTPTTPAPTTTTPATTTAPTPKQETAPTKTSSTPKETPASKTEPAKTSEPAKSSTEPTATTATKSLPFTGLNLTWIVIGGVLLVAMGASILLTQRRRQGAGR